MLKASFLVSAAAVVARADKCVKHDGTPLPNPYDNPDTGETGACIATKASAGSYMWHCPWESNGFQNSVDCNEHEIKYDCSGTANMVKLLSFYHKMILAGTTYDGTPVQTQKTVDCIRRQCPNLPRREAESTGPSSASNQQDEVPQSTTAIARMTGAERIREQVLRMEGGDAGAQVSQETVSARMRKEALRIDNEQSHVHQTVTSRPHLVTTGAAEMREQEKSLRIRDGRSAVIHDDSDSVTPKYVNDASPSGGMPKCMVLPGIGGMVVQALLFACCLGVFYYKRKREIQKLGGGARSNEEFFLDASKQFAAAGWIHVMNLGFASLLNSLMSGADECEWYWINIMMDTTVGTGVAYFLLQVAMAFIRKRFSPEAAQDFKSGEDRDEDGVIDMKKYGKQLFVWLVVIFGMKFLMVLSMLLFSGPLLAIAGLILAPFLAAPWLKLLFVMIVFPILMDAFQIWMIDNFIKKRTVTPEGELLRDQEEGSNCVEAAADALVACSHRCEGATEEALTALKTNYAGPFQGEQAHKLAGTAFASLNEEDKMSNGAKFDALPQEDFGDVLPQEGFATDPQNAGGAFDTQFVFQTIINPVDKDGI